MSETYTIQPGDTLSEIARKYGVSLDVLIKANPQIDDPSIIQPGLVIEIPMETLKKAKATVFENKAHAAATTSAEKKGEAATAEDKKTIEAATVRHELIKLSYIGYGENFGNNIALTFDDGPDPVNTPIILEILRKKGIKATFFVLGYKAQKHPELIRLIVAEGHTLGNHTYDHPQRLSNKPGSRRITELEPYEIKDEMVKTQKAVDNALGYHYPLKQFRSPGGHCNETVAKVAREVGITEIVKWNVNSEDWANPGNESIISNVENGAKEKGGVILFHDNHDFCIAKTGKNNPKSPTVLEKIIQDMTNEKYNFKTVDELMAMKNKKAKD